MINPYQNLPLGCTILDLEQPEEERGECLECGKSVEIYTRLCMACFLAENGCEVES